jgi:hypothetical protein
MRCIYPRYLGCPILAPLGWESKNLNQLLSPLSEGRPTTEAEGPQLLLRCCI